MQLIQYSDNFYCMFCNMIIYVYTKYNIHIRRDIDDYVLEKLLRETVLMSNADYGKYVRFIP